MPGRQREKREADVEQRSRERRKVMLRSFVDGVLVKAMTRARGRVKEEEEVEVEVR